jgi:DNA-binding transcriptional ArsR family regulator
MLRIWILPLDPRSTPQVRSTDPLNVLDPERPAGQGAVMSDPVSLTFSALADPTRRAILSMLLEDDMAVTDVAAGFDISLAAVSRHLSVLARAGLIAQERRGRVVWCKLEPDALRSASVWMQGFGQFDPVDLDALERLLEATGSDG